MKKTLLKNVFHEGQKVDILIEGNKFKKISPEIKDEEAEEIQCEGKAIFPAFYNCHTHISMTLLKGLGDEKELMSWLTQDIWPREKKMQPHDIYVASKFAILEMIKGGTVFFNDMYQYPEETMKAINEMGIRGFVSKPEIGEKYTPEEFEEKKKKVLDFIDLPNPNKHDMFLHIHACETKEEVKICKEAHNCTPIEYLEELGLLTEKTLLAHCVHLTDKDIEIIKKYKCSIGHCPVSNLKLSSGMMHFKKLKDTGINITLGTDGSASNNSLSMLEEMKICALNAKIESEDPKSGSVDDIFKIATLNGAKAFGFDAGEIKEGKLADFILVDMNHYLLLPNYNLKSNLVFSAQNECITDVFCDGVQIMKDRKVENEQKICEEFRIISEKFKNLDNSSNTNC